ncbi:MAG: LCP family protein [bacterium]
MAHPPTVNLLKGKNASATLRQTGDKPVRFFISPITLAIVFVLAFLLGRASGSEAASIAISGLGQIPFLGGVRHLIGSQDRKLVGEADDRINILLIGMGGEGHDGPNLTDTLIVTSIRPSDGRVAMLSIPRDLLVPVQGHGWKKINSVNAYGEAESPGHGGELIRTTVEGLLGIDIPYYVRIDFEGFRSVIDAVGGVDIYVDRAFTDATYPTYSHGVQAISFQEGWQYMNGETALRYARSRHGNNGEGSDFARSKRQQKVLTALKEKMLSFKTFSSPSTVANMLSALQSNVTTNLDVGEILRLARLAQDVNRENITHEVLDNRPESVLVDSMVGGAYALLPKNNDWNELRKVAAQLFVLAEPPSAAELSTAPDSTGQSQQVTGVGVEIRNGNGQSGGARETAAKLKGYGFRVVKIGNADTFDYERTLVYSLTDRDSTADDRLKEMLPKVDIRKPGRELAATAAPGADYLIILGRD